MKYNSTIDHNFFFFQDSSGSGMAWRDYSETNYGYDAYDENKLGPNSMPLTAAPQHYPGPGNGHGHGRDRVDHGQPSNGYSSRDGGGLGPPSMSLPRPQHTHQSHGSQNSTHSMRHNGGGGGPPGGANGLNHNPDFYFMPSQRKYSGEVVRVYVDHNKR